MLPLLFVNVGDLEVVVALARESEPIHVDQDSFGFATFGCQVT
jgi:hypothetical protein